MRSAGIDAKNAPFGKRPIKRPPVKVLLTEGQEMRQSFNGGEDVNGDLWIT